MEEWTEGLKVGKMDRAYFIGTLLATAGDPKTLGFIFTKIFPMTQ